jgi:hypothetical protein
MDDVRMVSSAVPPSRDALLSGDVEYPEVLKLSASRFGGEEGSG